MATSPAARPSSPSIKLTLTVIVAIHRAVSGHAAMPRSSTEWPFTMTCRTAPPLPHSTTAAAIRPTNLYVERRSHRSSITPMTRIDPAATSSGPNRPQSAWPEATAPATMPTSTAIPMATPPTRGIGRR